MGVMKWYKRDPKAALGGMMVLTLEERGAYNTIIDLIYDEDGQLPDDERTLCRWLGCDVRVWRRIRARLIALNKISIEDGLITNFRATSEVDKALLRMKVDDKYTPTFEGEEGKNKGIISKKPHKTDDTSKSTTRNQNINPLTPLPENGDGDDDGAKEAGDALSGIDALALPSAVGSAAPASGGRRRLLFLPQVFPKVENADQFFETVMVRANWRDPLELYVQPEWRKVVVYGFWEQWVGNWIGEKPELKNRKENWPMAFAHACEIFHQKGRRLPLQKQRGF